MYYNMNVLYIHIKFTAYIVAHTTFRWIYIYIERYTATHTNAAHTRTATTNNTRLSAVSVVIQTLHEACCASHISLKRSLVRSHTNSAGVYELGARAVSIHRKPHGTQASHMLPVVVYYVIHLQSMILLVVSWIRECLLLISELLLLLLCVAATFGEFNVTFITIQVYNFLVFHIRSYWTGNISVWARLLLPTFWPKTREISNEWELSVKHALTSASGWKECSGRRWNRRIELKETPTTIAKRGRKGRFFPKN